MADHIAFILRYEKSVETVGRDRILKQLKHNLEKFVWKDLHEKYEPANFEVREVIKAEKALVKEIAEVEELKNEKAELHRKLQNAREKAVIIRRLRQRKEFTNIEKEQLKKCVVDFSKDKISEARQNREHLKRHRHSKKVTQTFRQSLIVLDDICLKCCQARSLLGDESEGLNFHIFDEGNYQGKTSDGELIMARTVHEMASKISKETGLPLDRLRLVSNGRVLHPDETCKQQGLVENSTIYTCLQYAPSSEKRKKKFKLTFYDKTKEPWGVRFDYDNWAVKKLIPRRQFANRGVRVGWKIRKVNEYDVSKDPESALQVLESDHYCQIEFYGEERPEFANGEAAWEEVMDAMFEEVSKPIRRLEGGYRDAFGEVQLGKLKNLADKIAEVESQMEVNKVKRFEQIRIDIAKNRHEWPKRNSAFQALLADLNIFGLQERLASQLGVMTTRNIEQYMKKVVQKVYRDLTKKMHPDHYKGDDPDGNTEAWTRIDCAKNFIEKNAHSFEYFFPNEDVEETYRRRVESVFETNASDFKKAGVFLSNFLSHAAEEDSQRIAALRKHLKKDEDALTENRIQIYQGISDFSEDSLVFYAGTVTESSIQLHWSHSFDTFKLDHYEIDMVAEKLRDWKAVYRSSHTKKRSHCYTYTVKNLLSGTEYLFRLKPVHAHFKFQRLHQGRMCMKKTLGEPREMVHPEIRTNQEIEEEKRDRERTKCIMDMQRRREREAREKQEAWLKNLRKQQRKVEVERQAKEIRLRQIEEADLKHCKDIRECSELNAKTYAKEAERLKNSYSEFEHMATISIIRQEQEHERITRDNIAKQVAADEEIARLMAQIEEQKHRLKYGTPLPSPSISASSSKPSSTISLHSSQHVYTFRGRGRGTSRGAVKSRGTRGKRGRGVTSTRGRGRGTRGRGVSFSQPTSRGRGRGVQGRGRGNSRGSSTRL